MTLEEFYEGYKESLNLARVIPMDVVKSLGKSLGIPMRQGEMHGDYIQRLANHLETLKVKNVGS